MGGFEMLSMNINCTDSCATGEQYLQGIQRYAHITHIFLISIYREQIGMYMKCNYPPPRQKPSAKISCENSVQCVQTAESPIFKGWEPHSNMCARLCKMCKKLKGSI